MDAPLVELVRDNLKVPASGMIVAGSESEAESIGERLQRERVIAADFRTTESGFTDFVVARRGDSFLKA